MQTDTVDEVDCCWLSEAAGEPALLDEAEVSKCSKVWWRPLHFRQLYFNGHLLALCPDPKQLKQFSAAAMKSRLLWMVNCKNLGHLKVKRLSPLHCELFGVVRFAPVLVTWADTDPFLFPELLVLWFFEES